MITREQVKKYLSYITKKQIEKYLPYIVLGLVLLLLLRSCNSNKEGQLAIEILKLKVNESTALVSKIKTENKTLHFKNIELEKEVSDIEGEIKDLNGREVKLRKDREKTQSKFDKYNHDDFREYFSERYKTKDVTSDTNGVTLKNDVPAKVASELLDKDVTVAYLKISREIVSKERVKLTLKDSIISNLGVEITNLNEIVTVQEGSLGNYKTLADKQEKEIIKEIRRNKALKITIPVAIGLGFVGGILIK